MNLCVLREQPICCEFVLNSELILFQIQSRFLSRSELEEHRAGENQPDKEKEDSRGDQYEYGEVPEEVEGVSRRLGD